MRKIQTIIIYLTLIAIVCNSAQGIGGGGGGWICAHFDNPTPSNWEEDVDIGIKGVQTCINITIDQGCTANVTFQWFNWTQHYEDWDDWIENPVGEPPSFFDDSYWYNYSSWTNVNTSTQLCQWNANVSCYTSGATPWFDWRVIGNFTCGNTTYNETCYYYFMPEDCPLFYIYPAWNATNICPCCDGMCVGVRNDLGHNMNVTVYGRQKNKEHWHISNGTYCFCLDTIQPSTRAHAVMHSHHGHSALAINNWYNISFDHGDATRVDISDLGNFTMLEHGRYAITYWGSAMSKEANPNQDRMAIRVINNGTEIDGSYREIGFSIQGVDRNLAGQIQLELNISDVIGFQYVVDDLDSYINQTGTWSDDNISFYAYIRKTGMEEFHPLQFNTTYYWYVNITDASTGVGEDSFIYSFTTADFEDCFCGNLTTALADAGIYQYYKAFVIGLLGLAGLAGLKKYKGRKKE